MMFLEPANFNRLSRMYDLIVNISWEAPSKPRGVILAYSYRLVATSDSGDVIIEYINTTMLSAEHSVMVSPFTNYTATVVAFTSAGSGDSAIEISLSPEAGNSLPVCMYPVQNLTVTFLSEPSTYNSTTRTYNLPVSISWQPPRYPNGQITVYSYKLVETNATGRVLISYTTTTNLSVEHNVIVSPFTNYTATVVAFTTAGEGDSVMEVVLSPEASKFDCTCILSWRP